MAKEQMVDIANLTPQDRLALIEKLQEDHRAHQREYLLKTKEEFKSMARERGFTLGQLDHREDQPKGHQARAEKPKKSAA